METNKILSANVLDILFEGRNKAYGAYDLRKSYNRRITTALGVTAAVMIFISLVAARNIKGSANFPQTVIEVNLSPEEKEKEKSIPPPQKLIEPIKSVRNTPPIIVIDKLVTEPPIEVEKLAEARIDIKTVEGKIDDGGIIQPQEIKNSQIIEIPKKLIAEDNLPFTSVEIEAKFKGDWGAYLKKEIEKNIDELTEAGESGTCVVKFIVSKDGSVSEVEAITMKGSKLCEVAVNAIRKGAKWIPAQQNGREVNAYRHQPVTFKINE